MKITQRALSLLLWVTCTTGCATLSTDPVSEVIISSEPLGAAVKINSKILGYTPLKLMIKSSSKKGRRRSFLISKPGYKDAKVILKSAQNNYIYGNLVWLILTSGTPSTSTDVLSEYYYIFKKSAIVVEMIPLATQKAQEDQIQIQRAQIDQSKRDQDKEASELKSDQLVKELNQKLKQQKEEFEKEIHRLKMERELLKKAKEEALKQEKKWREEREEIKKRRDELEGEYEYIEEIIEEEVIEDPSPSPPPPESVQSKERRLLKKMRDKKKKREEKKKRRKRDSSPKDSRIPMIEVSPLSGSPSWGALGLIINGFADVQKEIAHGHGELLKSFFIRTSLSLSGGRMNERREEGLSIVQGYQHFITRIIENRSLLLHHSHGLSLYRALKRIVHQNKG